MIPIDKVENIVSRFNELESILAKPDLKKDEFVSNSKEYSNLNEIISYAKDYLKVLEDLKSTKNILEDKSTDKEFYEMAEKELKDLKQQEEECVKKLKVFLLPKDEADEKNAIIEIRAGTGGMEAALFAADLFNMYQKVAVLNSWKVEILEQRLSHIKEPLTLSIIGCVVNGPGEASQTDIGLTGGGKGSNMIYLSGLQDHKVPSEKIIEHIVGLVEKKAEQIRSSN